MAVFVLEVFGLLDPIQILFISLLGVVFLLQLISDLVKVISKEAEQSCCIILAKTGYN